MKKIGAICSAGGSAFFTSVDILFKNGHKKEDFFLVTDRECGAEKLAQEKGIPWTRVTQENFSKGASDALSGCDVVLMYYCKMVTEELFLSVPTLNIHPALLPAFKGFRAPLRAKESGVKFLGATLHLTTKEMDWGPIVAQIISPIDGDVERLSYLQKVYLTLVAVDMIEHDFLGVSTTEINWKRKPTRNWSASPNLNHANYRDLFDNLQKSLDYQVVP